MPSKRARLQVAITANETPGLLQSAGTLHRRRGSLFHEYRSRLFEITRVLVCFNHIANRIINADHRIL
jgi:hypothetical protein